MLFPLIIGFYHFHRMNKVELPGQLGLCLLSLNMEVLHPNDTVTWYLSISWCHFVGDCSSSSPSNIVTIPVAILPRR